METRTALPAVLILCCLAPVASALPLPISIELPAACNGSVIGCADILAPVVEPTDDIPPGVLPEPEEALAPASASTTTAPDGSVAPASAAPSAPQDAADAPVASPRDASALPRWALIVFVVLALGLSVGIALAMRREERLRAPRRTRYEDAVRGIAMHEDLERSIAEARAQRSPG